MLFSPYQLWRLWNFDLISLLNCGLSNTSVFIFFITEARKCCAYVLETVTFYAQSLNYCFIRTSLMWRGRKIIFSWSTSGWFLIFGSPTFKHILTGQFFWVQCMSLALLSHRHKKNGYFVYPSWWPSKTLTILRSTQMIQLWSSYLSNSRTFLMCPYPSYRMTNGNWTIWISIME